MRRTGWNLLGVAIAVVLVFPVFWMISTAFKPDEEVNSLEPTWFSFSPTLQHFRDAMGRAYFWDTVQNSLIVVSVTMDTIQQVQSHLLAHQYEALIEKSQLRGKKKTGAPKAPARR